MIEIPSFIDLHTHTRYPDKNNFPIFEIEKAALNGGYSEVLAMANSEIIIDSIENLKLARSFDKKLDIKVCLLYTSPSPRDVEESRMPSSA